MNAFARALAMLGPVGLAPIAPASVASAVVVAIGWFIPPVALPLAILALVAGGGIVVWACGEAEKTLGHDAKPIVADELIGQSIALLGAPHHAIVFGAAFVLFRIFDVWKPLGARQVQRLPGGWGVVTDDVIAGVIACAVLHAGLIAARALGWVPGTMV